MLNKDRYEKYYPKKRYYRMYISLGLMFLLGLVNITYASLSHHKRWFLITCGASMIVNSTMGVFALLIQRRKIMITFGVVCLTSFFLALITCVWNLVKFVRPKERKDLASYLVTSYLKYKYSSQAQRIITLLQINHKCCGLRGPKGHEVFLDANNTIIPTCCQPQVPHCEPSVALTEGCREIYVAEWLERHAMSSVMALSASISLAITGILMLNHLKIFYVKSRAFLSCNF